MPSLDRPQLDKPQAFHTRGWAALPPATNLTRTAQQGLATFPQPAAAQGTAGIYACRQPGVAGRQGGFQNHVRGLAVWHAQSAGSLQDEPAECPEHLGNEVQGCDLEDVAPEGHAVHLAQQVLDGQGLRVLAQHLEGVALGAHILLGGQHLPPQPAVSGCASELVLVVGRFVRTLAGLGYAGA